MVHGAWIGVWVWTRQPVVKAVVTTPYHDVQQMIHMLDKLTALNRVSQDVREAQSTHIV